MLKIIAKIFVREVLILKKRPTAWVLLLVIPLGIFFYLGSIYQQGAIDHVSIAIKDNDHSALSRKIAQYVQASPKLNVVKFLNSNDNVDRFFRDNPDIKGLYFIPENFSKNVFAGKQEKLIVYTNSSNIIYGNLLYKEAATFINTISAGINLNAYKLKGIPHNKAIKMVMPITVVTKPMFNSYYNYLYYLLPGLTTVLLQMIVFFLAARSINSEYNRQSFKELLKLANGNILILLLGKLATYTFLGFLVGITIFSFIHPLLGVPIGENTISFLTVVLIFVMTNAMLGIMVSTIFKNEAMAMDVSFVYNSPAFVFSGFTFPIMAMPSFNMWYAQLIPYTHFLNAFIKGIEMKTPMSFIYQNIINLLMFFVVGYVVASTVLLIRLKKSKI